MDAIKQSQDGPDQGERRGVMQLLAQATIEELRLAVGGISPAPEVFPIRGPETGLVMVRGRIGGGGDPFNLGEATVTRATVRLGTGEIGHGQMLGTDRDKARLAAILDALWQRADQREAVELFLTGVRARLETQDRLEAEQTAATRVDFFTMVRGDD